MKRNNFIKMLLCVTVCFSSLYAYELPTSEQIKKDFEEGFEGKYHYDGFPLLSPRKLAEDGILGTTDVTEVLARLTRETTAEQCGALLTNNNSSAMQLFQCPAGGAGFTTTISAVDPRGGVVQCLVAPVSDLYRPIGVFEVSHKGCATFFAQNIEEAKNDPAIAQSLVNSEAQFQQLLAEKRTIRQSVLANTPTNQYLTIPDLFLSAILTDTDVINLRESQLTSKLVLNQGYNATVNAAGEVESHTQYLGARASTMSVVYARLSDLSVSYLGLLAMFFGIWGAGGAILRPGMDKLEGQQNHDKKYPYIGGVLLGALLFFPTGNAVLGIDQLPEDERYAIYHTKFQEFERTGYYLFMDWAHDAAKVIVDAELGSVIARSGIASKDTILNAEAGKRQAERMVKLYEKVQKECWGVYQGKNVSETVWRNESAHSVDFPVSETYMYASAVYRGLEGVYYNPVTSGGFVRAYASGAPADGSHFPPMALSGCGHAEQNIVYYKAKEQDFKNTLDKIHGIQNSAHSQAKIDMLKQLIRFQYQLERDWGALSILGLPITVMQTEARGILLPTDASDIKKKLAEGVKGEDNFMHSVASTIPYLFIPGMGAIHTVINENIGKIVGAAGAATGAATSVTTGGLLAPLKAAAGALVGVAVSTVAGGALSLLIVYHVASNILALAPILAILLIGIVRFSIILIKIFSFHFISIFMLPLVFAKENWKAAAAFGLKIFATMVELPVFVLSIWLAMTANNIIQIFGGSLAKHMVIGMLESNAAQYGSTGFWGGAVNVATEGTNGTPAPGGFDNFMHNSALTEWLAKLKIYMYDGFIDVGIAVFGIVIVYKIISSIHTSLMEVFEVKSSQALDNMVEDMQSKSSQWGTKV